MSHFGMVVMLSWLMVTNAWAVQPLARLFYTPQQRVQIDQRHIKQQYKKVLPRSPAPVVLKDTHYNGYVTRSDGVNTVWVNGQTRFVDKMPLNPQQIKLPATPALKPGQAFNSQSGRVLESYEQAQPVEPDIPVASQPRTMPQLARDLDDDDGNRAPVENAAAY